jgi:hypothetical protein
MKVIYSSIIPPKGYKAITILNCIFVRKGCTMSDVDINHEEIHWEQEKELWIIGFYLLYVLDFIRLLLRYQKWRNAYRGICFEREAYFNEDHLKYRSYREKFAWKNYKL